MSRPSNEVLVSEPPHTNLKYSVIVPARNEEELLPSALQALAEQTQSDGSQLAYDSYEVIVLINNSTDRSAQVAESFRWLYPGMHLHVAVRSFDKSHAHVGYARRLLMDEACRRLETVGGGPLLVLSTDSDTRVAPNWICQNAKEIGAGVEAVGGRIVVLPCEWDASDSATRDLYRYDHLYRRLVCWLEDRCDPEMHDPWPRHYQHFGASLAITPRAYQAAKRLPPRRYLEDVAFYDALVRCDTRIRHSNAVRVFTSGRLNGRTRFGLSRQLRDWQHSRKRPLRMRVESARFLEHLFRTRRELRQIWIEYRETKEISDQLVQQLSSALGMCGRGLLQATKTAHYFGALIDELRFYERCRSMWPHWMRLAKLAEVVDELFASFEADRRSHARSAEMAVASRAK